MTDGRIAFLHIRVHAHESADLPRQQDRLAGGISRSGKLLGDRVPRILAVLGSLPQGKTVCHGDFHADNILVDGTRAVPIDWTNACAGHPAADVARSLLMMRSPYLPPGLPAWMNMMANRMKRVLLDAYLDEYLKLSGMRISDVDRFMLPVAAARIREGIPGEQDWLLGMVDAALAVNEA
jgi:hypothetical protein